MLAKRVLADGAPVAPLTATKLIKDFVVDFLLTFAATIGGIEVFSIPTDNVGWNALVIGAAGALFKAVYRALLRWGTS